MVLSHSPTFHHRPPSPARCPRPDSPEGGAGTVPSAVGGGDSNGLPVLQKPVATAPGILSQPASTNRPGWDSGCTSRPRASHQPEQCECAAASGAQAITRETGGDVSGMQPTRMSRLLLREWFNHAPCRARPGRQSLILERNPLKLLAADQERARMRVTRNQFFHEGLRGRFHAHHQPRQPPGLNRAPQRDRAYAHNSDRQKMKRFSRRVGFRPSLGTPTMMRRLIRVTFSPCPRLVWRSSSWRNRTPSRRRTRCKCA